jgi:hypothetical protein
VALMWWHQEFGTLIAAVLICRQRLGNSSTITRQ